MRSERWVQQLRVGNTTFSSFHNPARLRKSVWDGSGSRLRCIELSVDSAENLELIVFAETCSGAWFWIEYVIPTLIGWTIRRPPTDGTVVDLSDRKQSVQSALHVVVVEHAFASNVSLAMPFKKQCLPEVSAWRFVVEVADRPRNGVVTCQLAC